MCNTELMGRFREDLCGLHVVAPLRLPKVRKSIFGALELEPEVLPPEVALEVLEPVVLEPEVLEPEVLEPVVLEPEVVPGRAEQPERPETCPHEAIS